MPERNSWAVALNATTGLISVEDARVAIGALMMPGNSFVNSRPGFRPAAGSPGLVTPTPVTPDGNVRVAPFQYVMPSGRAAVAGAYVITLDAQKVLNILSTPANAVNNRNDLIIAQQSDTFYTDANSAMVVKQVVGTPSGTPVDPTVTGSPDYITLARVVVRANTTSILGSDITDLRPATAVTVALGGVLPVGTQAVRDAIAAPYGGLPVWRQDKVWLEIFDGTAYRAQSVPVVGALADITNPLTGTLVILSTDMGLYRYTGSGWLFVQSFSATGGSVQYKAAALQTVATGSVDKLKFGTAVMTSTADVTVSGVGNTDFTLQRTGRWLMQANVPWAAGPNGNFSCWAWVGSATDSTATGRHTVASGAPDNFVVFLAPNKVKRLNSGTVLSVYGYQDTGVSRNVVIDQGDLDVTFTFLGP